MPSDFPGKASYSGEGSPISVSVECKDQPVAGKDWSVSVTVQSLVPGVTKVYAILLTIEPVSNLVRAAVGAIGPLNLAGMEGRSDTGPTPIKINEDGLLTLRLYAIVLVNGTAWESSGKLESPVRVLTGSPGAAHSTNIHVENSGDAGIVQIRPRDRETEYSPPGSNIPNVPYVKFDPWEPKGPIERSAVVVGTGQFADATTIPEALETVKNGGVIFLTEGEYAGSFRVDKPVTFVGLGDPEKIIIKNIPLEPISIVEVTAGFSGLTVEAREKSDGAPVEFKDSKGRGGKAAATFAGCTFLKGKGSVSLDPGKVFNDPWEVIRRKLGLTPKEWRLICVILKGEKGDPGPKGDNANQWCAWAALLLSACAVGWAFLRTGNPESPPSQTAVKTPPAVVEHVYVARQIIQIAEPGNCILFDTRKKERCGYGGPPKVWEESGVRVTFTTDRPGILIERTRADAAWPEHFQLWIRETEEPKAAFIAELEPSRQSGWDKLPSPKL